jgi:hypothetical protein
MATLLSGTGAPRMMTPRYIRPLTTGERFDLPLGLRTYGPGSWWSI